MIGLKFTFSKEMFENTTLGIDNECKLIRIDEKTFHIIFQITAHDLNDKFNIFIDDKILNIVPKLTI